jgi:hypothetical protein
MPECIISGTGAPFGQKKSREPCGCGKIQFFKRKLEETGATIDIRPRRVCFFIGIPDIHIKDTSDKIGAFLPLYIVPHGKFSVVLSVFFIY